MGSGGGDDQPKMPGAQKKLFRAAYPMLTRMIASGMEGKNLWNVPPPVLPTQKWWGSLSPEVKQGLFAPYQEAGSQLYETMLSKGQGGSQVGGASGAAGVAMGEFAAKAGQQVGLQAWDMTSPQMMEYRNQLLQAQQAPYTMTPGYLGGMGQLPMYATPNRPSPYVGAAGGAAAGAGIGHAIYPGGYGAAIGGLVGGVYGYYANRRG